MKQHLLAFVTLLGCLLTSCSNADVVDGISDSFTRSVQSGMIDLRDYGKVHNMMMDFAQTYMIENNNAILH